MTLHPHSFSLFALLLLLGTPLAPAVHAYTATGNLPLQVEAPGSSWATVVADATSQSQTPGSPGSTTTIYSSFDVVNLVFEGDFTPDINTTSLALLSDDGCNVTIDYIPVLAHFGATQHLPVLSESLSPLLMTLVAGHTYHIRIDYSNVNGQPIGYVDGCTLFAFNNKPVTTFTSGLTGGVIRACAGAVADPVHEATVTFNMQRGGTNAAGEALVVSYDSSVDYTGCQAPQLIDDQHQNKPVPTLTRTTDANGNITVTVLSSDLISQPNLIISDKGNQVGSAPCDFATDQSKRRYGILTYDPAEGNDTDTGWDFDPYSLANPGDTADALVFLKFQKDPSIPIDKNYYLSSLVGNKSAPSLDIDGDGIVSDDEYNAGTSRGTSANPLNDASNWLPVNGHTINVRITQIVDLSSNATITDPATIQNYLYYVNGNGVPIDSTGAPVSNPNSFPMPQFVPIHTGTDGSATLHLKAGPLVLNLGEVDFEEVDETQPAINGTGTF